MGLERKLERMLKENRFKLIRCSRHRVYQNDEGKNFVVPTTPSDMRWVQNSISDLKRVLANPPKPLTLAISDFEREQATLKIQGQSRPKIGISGSGKSGRSNGTGFIYEDKVETVEQKRQRELLAKQAIENRQRREQRRQERRANKLARRQQTLLEREKERAASLERCGWFLDVISGWIKHFADERRETIEFLQKERTTSPLLSLSVPYRGATVSLEASLQNTTFSKEEVVDLLIKDMFDQNETLEQCAPSAMKFIENCLRDKDFSLVGLFVSLCERIDDDEGRKPKPSTVLFDYIKEQIAALVKCALKNNFPNIQWNKDIFGEQVEDIVIESNRNLTYRMLEKNEINAYTRGPLNADLIGRE